MNEQEKYYCEEVTIVLERIELLAIIGDDGGPVSAGKLVGFQFRCRWQRLELPIEVLQAA